MSKKNTGNSGEYFVAGELERRKFTVAVPMSDVEGFDLLCINQSGRQFALQVKTTYSGGNRWMLSPKNERIDSDNIFYVFVHLHELGNPSYHIVPSHIIAESLKKGYKEWINSPGKKGQTRNENRIRIFEDYDNKYLNKWEYLD